MLDEQPEELATHRSSEMSSLNASLAFYFKKGELTALQDIIKVSYDLGLLSIFT